MQKRAGLPAAPYLLGKRARLITLCGPKGIGRALTAHPPVVQASRFRAEPIQPKIPPPSPSECSLMPVACPSDAQPARHGTAKTDVAAMVPPPCGSLSGLFGMEISQRMLKRDVSPPKTMAVNK